MEEIIYEGYAPGGVALIVEAATDNKNRTAADMRSIFSKNHGNLGGPKCFIYVPSERPNYHTACVRRRESAVRAIADAGAEDLTDDEHYIITTQLISSMLFRKP